MKQNNLPALSLASPNDDELVELDVVDPSLNEILLALLLALLEVFLSCTLHGPSICISTDDSTTCFCTLRFVLR